MRTCVLKCRKYEKLYQFPNDPIRRKKWQELLQCEKVQNKHLYACSNHFSKEQICEKSLIRTALPDINLSTDHQVEEPPAKIICVRELSSSWSQNNNPVVEPCSTNNSSNVNFNPNENTNTESSSYLEQLEHKIKKLEYQNLKLTVELSTIKKENIKKEEEIKNIKDENHNLKIELNVIKNEKKKNEDEIFQNKLTKLPKKLVHIVLNAFENIDRKPKGRRYNTQIKTIALGVFFLSPMCYRYLKNDLIWPSESCLQEFVSEWPKEPGLKSSHLKLLELRTKNFTDQQKCVSISCDEMSLKTHMQYDKKTDKIIGVEDYGDNIRSTKIATHALVFFVKGIGGQAWKQPLCYYLVNHGGDTELIKSYLFQIIEGLQRIGLKPKHFVCDQGPNFLGLYTSLKVSAETPYFVVNGQIICAFHDNPHLTKSVRNCLVNPKNDVYFRNHLVSWKDIEYFYEIDSKSSYRIAPKLTDNHVNPHRLQHMRVFLATQILSRTVSSGLNILYSSGLADQQRALTMPNTSSMLLFFNNIFDLFNSSSPNQKFGKEVFTASECQLNSLRDAENDIKSIKIFDKEKNTNKTKTFSFLNGWLLNFESLKMLWAELKKEGFEYLATRRLCQDDLEHFFGEVRRGGGNTDKVTPTMFCNLFQKRWGLNYVDVVINGNCEVFDETEPSESIATSSVGCLPEERNKNIDEAWEILREPTIPDTVMEDLENVEDVDERTYLEENALTYVSGYLYRKLFQTHQCLSPLPTSSDKAYDDKYSLILEKEFDGDKLVKPPEDFLEYVKKLETIFAQNFNSVCHISGISKILLARLSLCDSQYSCCENMDKEAFIILFIRIRIYFVLKFFNRDAAKPNFRRQVLKLSHL